MPCAQPAAVKQRYAARELREMRWLARFAERLSSQLPLQSTSLRRMRCVVRIAEHLSSQRISQLAVVQQREAALAHLCKQHISQPAARSSAKQREVALTAAGLEMRISVSSASLSQLPLSSKLLSA